MMGKRVANCGGGNLGLHDARNVYNGLVFSFVRDKTSKTE